MGDEIDLSGAVDMLKNMLSSDEGSSAIENIMSMFSDAQETPGVKTGGIDEGSIEMMMKMQKIMIFCIKYTLENSIVQIQII